MTSNPSFVILRPFMPVLDWLTATVDTALAIELSVCGVVRIQTLICRVSYAQLS